MDGSRNNILQTITNPFIVYWIYINCLQVILSAYIHTLCSVI